LVISSGSVTQISLSRNTGGGILDVFNSLGDIKCRLDGREGGESYVSGSFGISVLGPTTALDVAGNSMRLRTARTPASATATGLTGEISWDANYLYVCTATNTWKRAAIGSW
jgi:hypothetical protein